MARRWRDPSAFRADPAAVPAVRPSNRQSLALFLVLVLAAGAVVAASYLISPDRARAFDLLHGSLFIGDNRAPVAVDLPSAKPTVRIGAGGDAITTVGASLQTELKVLPLAAGTLLLNTSTGEFNMIDSTGFVMKHDGGVPLPQRPGTTSSVGIPAGDTAHVEAYIEQTGPSGTSVYLVTPTTVQGAVAAGAAVKPRGFISMKAPGSTDPGAATSAGDSLWLLLSSGGRILVRQLSVPANSSAGVGLHKTDHGTVTGPAALGSTTAGSTTSGTVGVATPDSITLFSGSTRHTVRFTAPADVRQILPASNQDGRLSFLMLGTSGWSVVSVNPDGTGLRRPVLLTSLPPTARLVEPAQSRGALYTADSVSGDAYRIDAAGTASDLQAYPRAEDNGSPLEDIGKFSDIYVIARESRVFVDSPSHLDALAIFTDTSRTKVTIQKSAGVSVSAAGGAEELAQSHTRKPKPPISGTPPPPPPRNGPPPNTPPTTNLLHCAKTGQQPHIPQGVFGTPKSRSVSLSWTYPILDREDCVPRTYYVNVSLLSTNAPAPPESVRVPDGATSVNITGLFPSTTYAMTVSAFIGTKSATSGQYVIRTGPEGPAAPSHIKVVADAAGNWDLSWSSCGSVEEHCVPVATWDLLPSICDGLGGGQQDVVQITGDPTSKQQAPYTYVKPSLLGRGLSFEIEGVGNDGTIGATSASTPCVTSWSPPVPGALTLTASNPPNTSLGGTTATTVNLDLGPDATHDVGGLGATMALTLTGPAGAQTKKITYNGSSTHVSATFGGIKAGANYSATATVAPPGPGGHTVTLGPVPVTARSDWPAALAIDAHCPRVGLGLTCDLSVTISGLKSSDAHDERFDLTADSRLQCGTVTKQLALTNFDPEHATITLDNVSQLNQLVGECTVFVGLVENAGSPAPLYFGGTVSPTISTSVDLGSPARANLTPSDLDVAWGNTAIVTISAHDADAQNRIDTLTDGWTEEVDAPDGTVCGTSSPSGPQDLDVATSCVDQHGGDQGPWTVTLTYTDKSDGKAEGPLTYKLAGPVPGYQPCTPASFTASWGATIADGVTADYLGTDPGVLAGCSKWQYTLLDPSGASCGSAGGQPPTDGTGIQITLTCGTTPSVGWTVEVDYQDTAGDPQTINVNVGGTPPET